MIHRQAGATTRGEAVGNSHSGEHNVNPGSLSLPKLQDRYAPETLAS
jgi:hypothetical protein